MIAAAAGAAPLAFRSATDFSALGLRFRTPAESSPEPLPPHRTYTYTFTRGDESFTRELFDTRELWYSTQHAGQWRDAWGNRMILGRATHRLPVIATQTGHVAREDFDRAIADPAARLDPEDAAALASWVADFAGTVPGQHVPLRTGMNLTQALFFPTRERNTLIYTFRVRNRNLNRRQEPSGWCCAVLVIGDGAPPDKVRMNFETQFLGDVAAIPSAGRPSGAGRNQASELTPLSRADRKAADKLPDHPGRDAARKSIANMRGWWYADTPDHIILSDIRSSAGRALVKELQTTMPAMHAACTRLVPPIADNEDIGIVRIYEDAEAYRRYVGHEYEWSSGIWHPMRRELVVLWQGDDRRETMRIIRHEGFHQYLSHAGRGAEHAMWFNEGHACLFEAAEIDNRGKISFPEGGRLSDLLNDLDVVTRRLPQILRADSAAFYDGDNRERMLNYTTAWGLVYFLRKGVPGRRMRIYEPIIERYLETIAATGDGVAATRAAFAGIDMQEFGEAFDKFWRKHRTTVRHFNPLDAAGRRR